MPTYREGSINRRKSDNIIDLRPKTPEEREAMYRRLLAKGGNAFDTQIRGEAANRQNDAEVWGEVKAQEDAIRKRMREIGMDKGGFREKVKKLDMNSEQGRAEYEELRISRLLAMRMGI